MEILGDSLDEILIQLYEQLSRRSHRNKGTRGDTVGFLGVSLRLFRPLVSNPSRRKSLRQLDHAAIFLMIAGTYTPFTTCRLHGVWAIGMTGAVWTAAVAGAVTKLLFPGRFERGSVVA